MRNGVFRTAIVMLVCGLLLFPFLCQAGSVKIPGYNGSSIASMAPPTRTTMPAPQPSITINLPGFYGPTVTPPAPNALPTNPQIVQGVSQNGIILNSANDQLTIQQDQPQAIINWSSFNIGANASVYFDQKTVYQQTNGTNATGYTNWVVLNRIFDSNPSMIFGKLTADGKIYLINQNGILFGPGSTVNVNSLIASALNIKDEDFLSRTLNFLYDSYSTTGKFFSPATAPTAAVSNLGEINAGLGGYVFLMGPRVENIGLINAPVGQIGLAAGTAVDLMLPAISINQGVTSFTRTALIVDVIAGFGEAVNREGGQLISDEGLVGMYGGVVNEDGLIRSESSVTQHGQIELIARDQISTGNNSLIESPISNSSDTASFSLPFSAGIINLHGDFANPDFTGATPPSLIELKGVIDAPSGSVAVNARDRVFIHTGSSINVGGAWSNEAATATEIAVQLNSVELRDAYGQKGGLLQGQTINTTVMAGSSIGNISGEVLALQKTAKEQAVNGGTININASDSGDVVVKQGAILDFSGGGIRYSGGALNTTELLSGTNIYNIANAPSNIQYDAIIGQYQRTYDRFGMTVTYSGLYYGGSAPLNTTSISSFTSGGNAGTLQLVAGTVALDGQLNAAATRGLFQNTAVPYDSSPDSAYTLAVLQGLAIPTGGNLIIGNTPNLSGNVGTSDTGVKEIVVRAQTTPLQANFGADPTQFPLPTQQTVISASTVNAAGLGSLSLNANTTITVNGDAHIQLSTGGTFNAYARRIELAGDISAPAGTINLTLSDYILPPDTQLTSKIFLASGSRLDVSGERIDNSLVGQSPNASIINGGQTGGGTINLLDETDAGEGVFIATGAVVDVSGGYTIGQTGKVTGGNAGKLNIQGSNIMLNGDLRGYSLADPNGAISGGSITLSSTNITVDRTAPAWPDNFSADDDVPTHLNGRFVLAENRLDNTGFTQVTLNSLNDIYINTPITTSLVRLHDPSTALQGTSASGSGQAPAPDLISLDESNAFMAGSSSFSFNAGKIFAGSYPEATGNMRININGTEQLAVSPGAVVSTAPVPSSQINPSINLSAPALVDMSGTLQSLGGQIKIATTGGAEVNGLQVGDVYIGKNAQIHANGYSRPDTTAAISGLGVNYTSVGGGRVSLTAQNNVLLEEKSSIDVSGSKPVETVLQSGDGKIISYNDASDPGSLSLTFQGSLTWSGDVQAQAQMAGVRGGTLTISGTGTSLPVHSGDIQKYVAAGFDDVTLQSKGILQFIGSSGSSATVVGRQLTLDAQEISGTDGNTVALQSPWITLENTSGFLAAGSPTSGTGHLILTSTGWLDLNGSINISGFKDVSLEATRDIRLNSYYSPNVEASEGTLSTGGDLIMKADRIYPATLSAYYLYSAGKITILPADTPVGGTIYSANGSLTVGAQEGIELQGVLAAPMGTITLQNYVGADPSTSTGGRIYLADGSVVTTEGNATVNYGQLDVNGTWTIMDSKNNTLTVGNAPPTAVTINASGGEAIVRSQAQIITGGGGAVFAYDFQPGIEGSVNPLTISGRYVVFKNNSLQMPGDEVYLKGGGGLSAGMYTLLPLGPNYPQNAQYAFMPGAYILQQLTAGASLPGQGSLSTDGFSLTVGYTGVAGTSILSTQPLVYSVRPALDVLKEGNFDEMQTLTAGNAGDLKIVGKTAIIDGVLKGSALEGFQGGSITLIGTNINVQASTTPLSSGFNYTTLLPSELQGTLSVSSSSLSGQGLQAIYLGDPTGTDNITNNITIAGGSILTAPVISLTANTMINIGKGAQLQALAQNGIGEIDLNSPSGTLVVGTAAMLHASHVVNINVGSQDFQGNLKVDDSPLTLKGADIFFVPDSATETPKPGIIYITESTWSRYSAGDIILDANEIGFMGSGSFDLSAASSLTLDAASIVNAGSSVTLSAPTVGLKNSGNALNTPGSAGTGTFTVGTVGAADVVKQINISGDILFNGFKTISLNSYGDVTLMGKGSLTTGNAALNISAARVTTTTTSSAVANPDGTMSSPITAANFVVYTGANYYNDQQQNKLNPAAAITISNSGGSPGQSSTPGGTLEFLATRIDLSTTLQQDGGTISLISMVGTTGTAGTGGISLHSGAQILAAGTDDAPGGSVTLQSDSGGIIMEAASLDASGAVLKPASVIDVSAGKQGDAGLISLQAPVGGITIKGELKGKAQGGVGGSLVVDTYQVSNTDTQNGSTQNSSTQNSSAQNSGTDMGQLLDTIAAGGFTESVAIRAHVGNIDIAQDQTLTANHVQLTADDQAAGSGQINIHGKIDASASPTAGTVELYANNDLNIDGNILAKGTSKGEDDVILSSANGSVNLKSAGTIDVSGKGTGQGVVYIRAQQDGNDVSGNDVKVNLTGGSITGGSAVYVEAFKTYSSDTAVSFNAGTASEYISEARNYYNTKNTVVSRLAAEAPAITQILHLLPGIEVDTTNNSDITVTGQVLLKGYRFGSEPGVLTLRASGNLNIDNNIVDAPTPIKKLTASAVRNSWGFNLVAGADTSSADYMAVNNNGGGNLTFGKNIENPVVVYTESAPIRFASAGSTTIYNGPSAPAPGYMINGSMSYTLASFNGSIEGDVGTDLVIIGGAIQTATGDIDISVGRNLNITDAMVQGVDTFGAIRTTGWSKSITKYSTYTEGGNITLDVGGNVGKSLPGGLWTTALPTNNSQWDSASGDNQSGFSWSASYVVDSNSSQTVTTGLATMGGGNLVVRTGGDFLTQAGTFGQNDQGNLIIYAGGNINGRFLNAKGKVEINAMGNFGTPSNRQMVEVFDSQINLTTQGDIELAAVINPFLATLTNYTNLDSVTAINAGFAENASLSLKAGGNVTFGDKDPFRNLPDTDEILPPTLNVVAGGDIRLMKNFALLPAPTGSLSLVAGGSIEGSTDSGARAQIFMSDMAPSDVYTDAVQPSLINSQLFLRTVHATIPVHEKDTTPVVVQAGQDIRDLELFLPKKAEITAENGNIQDIFYYGQNINANDVSEIRAIKGNISFSLEGLSGVNIADTGIVQAGPGSLLLQAGGSINLGTTQGIQTVGNTLNPILGTKGSDLIIISGYNLDLQTADANSLFDTIRTAGTNYSTLLAEGQTAEAQQVVDDTRKQTIEPLLGSPSGSGNISMTTSQISTVSGQDNIYIIANGQLNVGKSTFFSNATDVQKTGIFTAGGGGINVYTNGDVNVNESRVMTFLGGDITVWSDNGNINAGRGSKAQVNASPPQLVPELDPSGDIIGYSVVFTPPAVGSGIRAVTYAPGGAASLVPAPPPGNIYLFAARGTINAGEAGISGGHVVLGATQILNAGNISFTSGAIGLPQPAPATGISTLSGTGAVAQTAQLASEVASIAATTAEQASQMIQDIMATWLDVKIIDFVQDQDQ